MTTQQNRATRRATAKKAPAKKAAPRKAAAKKPAAAAAIAELPPNGVDESRARDVDGVVFVPFTFRGDDYWFPRHVEDWSLGAMRAFEDDKALTALEYLFGVGEDGKSSYELLMSRGYRLGDVEELFGVIAEIGGFAEA